MVENVLLLTIDSLRWRFDQEFGNGHEIAPCLESLRSQETEFTNAFATGPGTQPSFPAMLTGTYLLSYEGVGALTENRPRVASKLQKSDLSTGGFQSNPFLSEQFNYDEGFDIYRDYQNPLMGVATKMFPRGIEISNPKLERIDDRLGLTDFLKRGYQLINGKTRPYVSADVITDDTIRWINDTDDPFFCWAHYMDVHHPCYPPHEYRERYGVEDVTAGEASNLYSTLIKHPDSLNQHNIDTLLALYSAAISYTDSQIDRLIDNLKTNSKYDDTLIILTSDHGEMFGEHNEYGKPPQMFDELLRVPLIVANGPKYLEAASDELVSLIDIPPLIHDALGLAIPPEYEGRIPGQTKPRTFVLGEHEIEGKPVVGVRSEDMLYEYDASQETERVYEVRDSTAVPTTNKRATPELREIVSTRLNQFENHSMYDIESEVDGDLKTRLEDLGYL